MTNSCCLRFSVSLLLATSILATPARPVPRGSPIGPPRRPLTGLAPAANVFTGGQEGYHTFRIPSVIMSPKGTMLAFCEGRKNGGGDSGDIDLILKRSTNGGETWDKLQVVWDDGVNTCGNPCPVVDQPTGVVWLLLTHNPGGDKESRIMAGTSPGARTVWVSHSADDGLTWSRPSEITKAVKPAGWTWYATGPGVGIQMRSGRLVTPCDHAVAGTRKGYSHVIFSDDHGATWQLGGAAGPGCNESQVAELSDGSLLLNMRGYQGLNRRRVATSRDGGLTFSQPRADPALIEPVCQASLLRYPEGNSDGPCRLLFSNPASLKREKMTVRLSSDEGKTWPVARELYGGPSAYSCLTVLPDGSIGCLFERGTKSPYENIAFARFTLDWLKAGKE
jgi:sialidase-1